jgi:prepilin-type N-terminal cleavage/methylation domain-containing protein/prepilin-type processing-associated H-X9-DG protein
MAMSSRRRSGFTLVELLVVITIIGMLVALLLPAVQSARENARTTQCLNHLGNLAKAMASFDSSRGNYPGHSQFVKRGSGGFAAMSYDSNTQKNFISNTTTATQPLSWAAMLLGRIERQDVWDQIVDANATPEIRRIDTFICPSDRDAFEIADRPALTYVANCGAWDRDASKVFLKGTGKGDIAANGVFFDQSTAGSPNIKMRMSGLNDGAATTLMLSENSNKSYDPSAGPSSSGPLFTWAAGTAPEGWEQQFGMVWVVNPTPSAGTNIDQQERICGNEADLVYFEPTIPRFARIGSSHRNGGNVAFCDSHVQFLRSDIDYTVYQRLMTANGGKCDDPNSQRGPNTQALSNGDPIKVFRLLAPLSNQDFE